MGRPLARTFACSLVLLSVCSVQSMAADKPAAARASDTSTAATTIRAQAWQFAFADTILPNALHMPHAAAGPLFPPTSWWMPLPELSTSKVTVRYEAVTATTPPANIARTDPGDVAPGKLPGRVTAKPDNEPFGVSTVRARQGLLWTKWRKVRRAIKAEAPALVRCRATASRCSRAAAHFAAIVGDAARRHGRARLELVNQRVNDAIRYVSDEEQWHRRDRWSAPFDRHHRGSFDTGKGDCEDYAIAKYVALRDAGTPAHDLRLLVVRDTTARSYHAVLAARQDGQWLLLDNRWRRLIPDNEARFFTPLFALNTVGVERFASARARHHQAPVKRIAKAHGRIILAGKLGPTRSSV